MKRKRGDDYNGPETWGVRFQRRRDSLGLSQTDIAEITGLTQQSISRIENDEVDPRFSTLEKLAKAVVMDVNKLFPTDLRPRGETPAAKNAKVQKRAVRTRQRARCK